MEFCFIILKHSDSKLSDRYWKHSYDCIRKIYSNILIVIIDDNSPYKSCYDNLSNTIVIESEFERQRGELLPYYYFYKNKFSKKAIIIHDSVFIHKEISVNDVDTYKSLWTFKGGKWDNKNNILNILKLLNHKEELINILNSKKWKGCFGVMTIINLNFLELMEERFRMFEILLKIIDSREKRCALERVFAILFINADKLNKPIFGDIKKYCRWGQRWNKYIRKKEKKDIEKIWLGR